MLVSTAITRKPPIKVDFPFDKIYDIGQLETLL